MPRLMPGKVTVRRARITLTNRPIWLPWWTLKCDCCAWTTIVWRFDQTANVALLHAAFHSPTLPARRVRAFTTPDPIQ
jgi:hypothetical protein